MKEELKEIDYKWQLSGHRYTRRVEIANNKLANQIIVASQHLVATTEQLAKLNCAIKISPITTELTKRFREEQENYKKISEDIRKLAKGQTIDEP